MTVLEQMRSFTEAAIVVSTHGPSLSHLVFARPRTLVVEVSKSLGGDRACGRLATLRGGGTEQTVQGLVSQTRTSPLPPLFPAVRYTDTRTSHTRHHARCQHTRVHGPPWPT
eukprot:scaffold8659_cov129-Isochrysis_galbana.AAC.4